MLKLKNNLEISPPHIFNEDVVYIKSLREISSPGKNLLINFCEEEVEKHIKTRNIENSDAIITGLPIKINGVNCSYISNQAEAINELIINESKPSFHISCFSIQHLNDTPGFFARWRQILKENGQIIGFIFGEESLRELKEAWYKTEEQLFGGISFRFSPLTKCSDIAQLLHRTHYALPTAYIQKFEVIYENVTDIITDIRALGLSNSLNSAGTMPLSRNFLKQLAKNYKKSSKGLFALSIDIICFTGLASLQNEEYYLQQEKLKKIK